LLRGGGGRLNGYLIIIIIIIIIIITMAQQPYMGLGLLFPRLRGLCAFAAVRDRPTAPLFNSILTDCQSHLAVSQETWVRNGRLNLAYGHYWFFFMPEVNGYLRH
jgi:hypothetical protein